MTSTQDNAHPRTLLKTEKAPAEPDLVRGGSVNSADGTHISYLARGSGPVIVCLHGGLGTAMSMLPLSTHLAADFEVVMVDLRGHGTSDRGPAPADIGRYIDDIVAVTTAVGPVRALFGYSFGAVIALETALAAPEAISSLALYEPPLPITYPLPDLTDLESALHDGHYEQLLLQQSALGGGFSPAELAALREDPLWMTKVAHAPTLLPTMQILSNLPPDLNRYSALDMPTTLITGTASASYLRRAGDRLTDAVPGLTHQVLSGQGHHVDHQLLAASLAAFAHR